MTVDIAQRTITGSLLASIIVSPLSPGLTLRELEQVFRRAGVPPGLAEEAVGWHRQRTGQWGVRTLMPGATDVALRLLHWGRHDRGIRSLTAYDFLHFEMKAAIEQMGRQRAGRRGGPQYR